MTDKYKALREAAEKATPGPWVSNEYGVGEFSVYAYPATDNSTTVVFVDHDPRYNTHDSMEQQGKDVAYVAAANPATIQALLAERDALRDALLESAAALQAIIKAGTRANEAGEIIMSDKTVTIREILEKSDAALS